MSTTTAISTEIPEISRDTARNQTPRWVGLVAVVAVALGAFVGVSQLRSDDSPSAEPATAVQSGTNVEPLFEPEEVAFLDTQANQPSQNVKVADWCLTHSIC